MSINVYVNVEIDFIISIALENHKYGETEILHISPIMSFQMAAKFNSAIYRSLQLKKQLKAY